MTIKGFVLVFSILNALGYILMFIDKKHAKYGLKRISEKSLLAIAAIGGSIGVLLAMYIVRHKKRKLIFKLGVPIMLIIHVALFFVLFVLY